MAVPPLRVRVLEHAATKIGVEEQPPGSGSNHGKIIDEWGRRAVGISGGFPWCACFVWNMFADLGHPIRDLAQYERINVAGWEAYADRTGNEVKRPFKGDLVAYSWNGSTSEPSDHIGFVEKVLAIPWPRNGRRFFIRTVEGNTGDAVRRRWRWVDPSTVVFIRVPDSA